MTCSELASSRWHVNRMNIASLSETVVRDRLARLYGDQADEALQTLLQKISAFTAGDWKRVPVAERWNQQDVVLITYGDQLSDPQSGETPIQTLHRFLTQWELPQLINTIHFLPFFPYSSDDGFSVIHYLQIDPDIGSWSDVHSLGRDCRLMFDFVVNHVSQESEWFRRFLGRVPPYDRFFIEVDPARTDVSTVTRPRSLPLLHEFETSEGPTWIWTTFSRDQVDLNYRSFQLLAEIVGILLEYVRHGAHIIRLDAIAYLWKEVGTKCIHLPQTHEFVKILRCVLEAVAPHVLLLTETNVPHDENVSYFGDGEEAQMVYQFSLPPLLLDAFVNHDAEPLKRWLAELASPPSGTTYFNFTASHDGIGVRPLEGHVDTLRLDRLVQRVRDNGGHVSTRRCQDGSDAPYELNITYLDALSDPDDNVHGSETRQSDRFLATQAVMLALQGMPAIYFHSLVGTPNDHAGVETSGIPRRINRHKYTWDELSQQLQARDSMQSRIFQGIQRLLRSRTGQPAFHPDAEQSYVATEDPRLLAFERKSRTGPQRILVMVNFGGLPVACKVDNAFANAVDLLDSTSQSEAGRWTLNPAQVRWLSINKV